MTLEERLEAARKHIENPAPTSGLAAVLRFEARAAEVFRSEGVAGRLVETFSGREIARVGKSRRVHDFGDFCLARPEIARASIAETREIRASGR